MEKEPVRVLVKGTFGGAVLKLIAQGVMLGEHQPVILYISDSSASANDLSTMQENLLKTGYPLLRDVIAKWEVIQTRKDVDFAIISQRCNLDQITAPNCKVLVISPSFSDVLTVRAAAPLIPMKNFTCLTRLEHNKALSSISKKVGIKVTDVKNVIIWGKSFSILNLDVNHAIVKTSDSEKSVAEIVNDDAWLDEDLVKAVLGGRYLRTFIEDAELPKAACDHIHDWVFGTPEDTWTSMGVYSDGSSYDVPSGIFFSFPVTCVDGEWKIVKGVNSKFLLKYMHHSTCLGKGMIKHGRT